MGKPVGFFVCVYVYKLNNTLGEKEKVLFCVYIDKSIFTGAEGSKGNRWRNGKISYKPMENEWGFKKITHSTCKCSGCCGQ